MRLLLLTFLAACAEETSGSLGDDGGEIAGAPDIAISTSGLSFGELEPGTASSTHLRIENRGTEDLVITASITGDPAFSVTPESATAPPGGAAELVVRCDAPTDGEPRSGELTIESNDLDDPVVVVHLGCGGVADTGDVGG